MKDRLEELKRARGDFSEDSSVTLNVVEEDKSKQAASFFNEIEKVGESLEIIKGNVEEIKRIHKSIVVATGNDKVLKERLEELMDAIKRRAVKIRMRLKDIEEELKKADKGTQLTADFRIKKTQHVVLSKKFLQIMSEYNEVQCKYRDKCKEFIQRQLEIKGQETTNEELEEMFETGNAAVFTQNIIAETQQEKQMLADIVSRHSDIMKLEKSIKDLHDMFMDMAMLVEQQGDLVDRIEFQVSQSKDYVTKAKEQTKQAVEYQKKARRKKIFIYICLIIVAAIIIGSILGAVLPSN